MKKSTRIVKKSLALFLVVLMSINTFAAVVGDNDGAAFITKAEFDSLKNDFQSQLDRYNSSIDNKIDGAIASYLAGIKMSATQDYDLLCYVTGENNLYFMNGAIKPDYNYPNLNYLMVYSGDSTVSWQAAGMFEGIFKVSYEKTWTDNEENKKPLIKLCSGDEEHIGSVYWDGIALRYVESISASILIYVSASGGYGNLHTPAGSKRIYYRNIFNLGDFGYIATLATSKVFNDITAKYQYKSTGSWTDSPFSETTQDFGMSSLGVGLGYVNQKQKDRVILCNYDGNNSWEVYNEEFTHTLRRPNSSYSKVTSVDYYNTLTADSSWWSLTYYNASNIDGSQTAKHQSFSNLFENDSVLLSCIGCLGMKNASDIYQKKNDSEVSLGTSTWAIPNIKLNQGLPVFAAKEDDLVNYDASFSSVKCFNTSPNTDATNYSTNANEVDIYLSLEPFSDDLTVSSPDKFIKFNGQNYITTTNRQGKISFKMPCDGVVYMKAVPHFETGSYNGLNDCVC